MAETFHFDLVSPERKLASVNATEVRLPGSEGDFTAMPGHAPFLTTLRPGIVVAQTEGGETRHLVTGGFAEVGPDSVSVLAERSLPAGELTQAGYDAIIAEARTAAAAAAPEGVEHANKFVADLVGLAVDLGLNPPQL